MESDEFKYDIEGFAKELEVSLEDISGLYSSYFEEMKSEVNYLNEYISSNDWIMLQRVVHNIKGVSANLNIQDVFIEAEKFDLYLKDNKTEDVQTFTDNLESLINAAETNIKGFFSTNGIEI